MISFLKAAGPGILAIASTYVFFLIYAQFAFLELAKPYFVETSDLDKVMMAMGLSGLASSLATAYLARKVELRKLLLLGLWGCAATATISITISGLLNFVVCSAFIGIFLGLLTVSLASSLLNLLPQLNFGLAIGVGTGLAYFICNLPLLFTSSHDNQAIVSAIICVATAIIFHLSWPDFSQNNLTNEAVRNDSDHKGLGFIVVVICFLALIWLDSSAFYIIQQTTGLKTATWHGDQKLLNNGLVHFVFALGAGALIDRGKVWEILAAAYVLLAIGVKSLDLASAIEYSSAFYCAGVSLYSTALVAFPSLNSYSEVLIPRRWQAGLLYAIAGWLGSAMGIGMARDLNRVPILFLAISGLVVISSYLIRRSSSKTIAIGLALLINSNLSTASAGELSAIQLGRVVYIEEGCINCHSQYVRANTVDVEMWGPVRDLAASLNDKPPLIGNRRIGPDLLNVGNRRNREWQRLHLIDPRSVSPGSVMPSYKHLFDDDRGENLISYLMSLGADTIPERQLFVESWAIPKETIAISEESSEQLFDKHCSVCHGIGGSGNSLLNQTLAQKAPALNTVQKPNESLARIIKFGIIGGTMPGHEYLSNSEVLGLVKYTKSLANK